MAVATGERAPAPGGRLLAACATVAAFVLYFWNADRSFSPDEANTVGTFVRPGDLLLPFRGQAVFNNHPLFSFAEAVIARATSTDERWMRLLPALLGALTVGLFARFAARRYGWPPALAGAAVLGTSPIFVAEVREARGYAVVAFCAMATSIVLVEDRRTRAARAVYVLALAVAVGTHLYALLVALAHAGFVLGRRPVDRRRLLDVLLGTALGGLAYVGLWREMLAGADDRGTRYRPEFGRDLAEALLGGTPVAVVVLAAVLATAAWTLGRRREVLLAAVPPLLVVLAVWQLARPTDLYPRFLIAASLPVAAAVGWAVRRRRWLLPVVLVAAASALAGQLDALGREPPVRRAAALVAGARDLDARPCAMGYLYIGAYTERPTRFTGPGQVPACDVVVQAGTFGDDMMRSLEELYPHAWSYAPGQAVVSRLPRHRLERAAAEAAGAAPGEPRPYRTAQVST